MTVIAGTNFKQHVESIVEQCIRLGDAPKWDPDPALINHLDDVAKRAEYRTDEERGQAIEQYTASAEDPDAALLDVRERAEQLDGYGDDPLYAMYRAAEAMYSESLYREVWETMHTPEENRYADQLETKANAASAAKHKAWRNAWDRGDKDEAARIDRIMLGWDDIAPNRWSKAWADRGKTTTPPTASATKATAA